MPRKPDYALTWSADDGFYELVVCGQAARRFSPRDEAAWQAWLGSATSFAFRGAAGSLNVYREARVWCRNPIRLLVEPIAAPRCPYRLQ